MKCSTDDHVSLYDKINFLSLVLFIPRGRHISTKYVTDLG